MQWVMLKRQKDGPLVSFKMKIIALGNRYIEPDGAALWFYDEAIKRQWHSQFNWIEGGLGGLNLSPHFETEQSILLLDYMPGFNNGEIYTLDEILQNKPICYDHSTALYYLLATLPVILSNRPKISLMACDPMETDWQGKLFQAIDKLVNKVD